MEKEDVFVKVIFFKEIYYTDRCTRINYKIVPVTNFNKYVLYGTSGNG